MKTLSKLSLFALASVAIIAVSCKGKSNTASTTSNGSDIVASTKGNSVMDSLNISDPDEKKVCALYDDVITDYLKEVKILAADTSKAAAAQRAALDQKYKDREKEIQPQIEAMRRKIALNPTEAMKFTQFSVYESKRIMAIYTTYMQSALKNYPTATPATK
jgi:hypothetical protein